MTVGGPRESDHVIAPSQALRRLFLTLFLRGRSARGLQKETAPKSVAQKLALVLVFYGLFGMFAVAFRGQSIFMLSAYLHTMTLMFLGMFVSSSAGEILFNREEADILMHRPIEPRGLLWAKVRVLSEVSLWLAGAFNLGGFFIGATMPGGSWRYPLAHALSTALQAFFCTGCVVTAYQLCLRWLGRERLEGMMTTAQVLISVAAVMSGQLIPSIMAFMSRGSGAVGGMWFVMLLPPVWFAGIDDALAGAGSLQSWGLAAAACAATALVLWAAFDKLTHDYEAGLQLLNEHSTRVAHHAGRRRWLDRLIDAPPLSWWLRDPKERAAFLLTAAYLARDRETKLRIYPSVAPYLMLPVVFLARDASHAGEEMGGFGLAFTSGYIGVVPMLAVTMMQFSQQWQAADIFRTAPQHGPGPLCHGARKAILLLLAFPIAIIMVTTAWIIQRNVAGLAVMLPGLIPLPLMALVPNMGGRGVPLSQPSEEAKAASRGLILMGAIMVTMGVSVVAIFAQRAGWLTELLVAELAGTACLYFVLRRSINRAPWPPID